MDPKLISAFDVMTLSYLFGFQIYFDFAGYSHIAIGSALTMGIKFKENKKTLVVFTPAISPSNSILKYFKKEHKLIEKKL